VPKCGKTGQARLSRADTYAFLMGDNETSVDFKRQVSKS
jgi:hypothetical protein